MEWLVALLPVLGCAGGMATCMWLMNRGHRDPTPPAPPDDEVAELRREVSRLRVDLDERQGQPRA